MILTIKYSLFIVKFPKIYILIGNYLWSHFLETNLDEKKGKFPNTTHVNTPKTRMKIARKYLQDKYGNRSLMDLLYS